MSVMHPPSDEHMGRLIMAYASGYTFQELIG